MAGIGVGVQPTNATINNALTQIALSMRNVVLQANNLVAQVNSTGDPLTYLTACGYSTDPNPDNPGGVSDAQLALNMVTLLTNIVQLSTGQATLATATNFSDDLALLWNGQLWIRSVDLATDRKAMSSTAEHVLWHPHVTVEKYSPDQARWAEFRLRSLAETGRRPELNHVLLGDHCSTLRQHRGVGTVCEVHGDWLRELFPGGPEDGTAEVDGNVLTNNGLTVLVKLLTGGGGTSYYPLAATNGSNVTSAVGVGTNNGGAGAQAVHPCTDTHLTDDGSPNAYYQGMDSAYPTLTTPATINGQSTFASGVANFQWNEWCWATGPTGTVTAGNALAGLWGTSSATFMLNHKTSLYSGGGATLGVKGAGAAWVFSTSLTFT